MSTVFARSESVRRDWYVVDASGKTLGRLATQVAMRLRGKHKAEYTPHVDTGDNIIVLNAEKIRVTGDKLRDKIYYWHTGAIGGIKSKSERGTIANMGTQGAMYDNLIRRDPRDSGQTIIPDLAHSWEIAKDGKTYTFHLRQDVQFHDGTDFTSADIKATFDRIAKPPAGVSIPRTPLFRAVSEINARDK